MRIAFLPERNSEIGYTGLDCLRPDDRDPSLLDVKQPFSKDILDHIA